MYAEKYVKPKVVWEYIPHDVSAVQGALLKAILVKKWSIQKISIDTYSKKLINEVFCELGMSIDNVSVKVMDSKLLDEEYTKHLVDFHIKNYKSNNANCCITGVRSVNKKMGDLKIPCILAVAPRKAILSTYSNLEFKYLIKKNRNSQIVVIAIKIDALDIHSVASKDEYSRMINRMQIMEEVYIFASNIEAAVSEISNKEILLFTTRTILETETNNYEEFSLMEIIEKKTFSTVSIGVGYGETANKAKFNALSGMEKASKDSKSSAYVVYNDISILKINRKECINSDKKN